MRLIVQSGNTRYFFLAILLGISSCASNPAAMRGDLFGVSVGMPKAAAVTQLEKVAVFETDVRKRQQVWRLREPKEFSRLAVGYDGNETVRYITAFFDAETATERVRFAEVGDLSAAKSEVTPPHHQYFWDVPSTEGRPAYVISVYGDNSEYLTSLSIANKIQSAKIKEYSE